MPPDKRKGPLAGGPLQKKVELGGYDGSQDTLSICVSQLLPRPVRPNEIPELRAIWWRQVALGHRLPVERGVIVLEGGTK